MRYLYYASLIAIGDKRLPAPRVPAAAPAGNRHAAYARKREYARCASAVPAPGSAAAKLSAIASPVPMEPAGRQSSANRARKLNIARQIAPPARPGFLAVNKRR